jgi:hypothetical protein
VSPPSWGGPSNAEQGTRDFRQVDSHGQGHYEPTDQEVELWRDLVLEAEDHSQIERGCVLEFPGDAVGM